MTPLLLSSPLLRTQSDGRLATLVKGGHDRAFEAIVERYRKPLQRYLRRLLSEPLAEDVLQATFVRAWQALRSGTEVQDLRPWLYRIAHNQAVNALRAAGTALPDAPEVPAEVASAEAEIERREVLRETLHGIGALPDRQRAAIVAVAVADRPHADVAAELGLSDGALRQLLLRARTALRTAATAITPYPMVTWLASGQEVSAARVTEVAAGAGGAGVAIKAGAAMLAAGAVVAGAPTLRDEHTAPRAKPATAAHKHQSTVSRATVVQATPIAARTTSAKTQAGHDQGGSSGSGHGSGAARSSSRNHGSRSSSGSGSSHSGSGGSDSGESEPVAPESSHSGVSGLSGSGESDSHEGGSGPSRTGARHDDHQTTSGTTDESRPTSGDEGSAPSGHHSDGGDESPGVAPPPDFGGGDGSGSGGSGSGGSGSGDG